MCLTIPAKVLELKDGKASVKDASGNRREIDVSLISGLRVGDWVLYITDLALRKISRNDAKAIKELLEPQLKRIDAAKIGEKFRGIIRAAKTRELTKEELIYLLKTEGEEKKALFSEANTARQSHLKDFICIHGIIEFSNFCQNDCFYCGLRKENEKAKRYRMPPEEIIETAVRAVKGRGYKLLVLQSGQDPFYTDEMLAALIGEIKKRCRVFVFMSVGDRGYDCYKKMKQAGASGALLRFETSDPELFKKIHPRGKILQNRFEHLRFLRELGYFIASGSLIGLPGQTFDDLFEDILMIKKWANMVSMGPFIPCDNTPLADYPTGNAELNLKMISVLRLLMPSSRIPVVTALETLLGEKARRMALLAGANSLMFNLTPEKYRPLYRIYPNKFFKKEERWEKYGLFKHEESYKMLEERMVKEINKYAQR